MVLSNWHPWHLAVDSATAWRNKRLLQEPWAQRVDPSVWINYAILFASKNGYYDVEERLLQEQRRPRLSI
jgi:hypothetical protein